MRDGPWPMPGAGFICDGCSPAYYVTSHLCTCQPHTNRSPSRSVSSRGGGDHSRQRSPSPCDGRRRWDSCPSVSDRGCNTGPARDSRLRTPRTPRTPGAYDVSDRASHCPSKPGGSSVFRESRVPSFLSLAWSPLKQRLETAWQPSLDGGSCPGPESVRPGRYIGMQRLPSHANGRVSWHGSKKEQSLEVVPSVPHGVGE
jgi:hypothetical protein